ncbi:MAG: TonB-dependent receptor [Xanthomonadaceae bacterium]|nr:TonB-dependent receptor [Xanthomonadaceae bacterium]
MFPEHDDLQESKKRRSVPNISPARNRFHQRALVLAIAGALASNGLFADDSDDKTGQQDEDATAESARLEDIPAELEPMTVDFRGERLASPKYQRPLLDTPRIISVLPQDLLEEQNVTSLRDAMRNIPGISLQAGEGNPPGGDQLKIRGFNAREDLNVDGVRDLGNYFRDPFYVEQIEVVKGPNSAFSGRGSAGGTINFVTKQPTMDSFKRIETSVGTDSYTRATVDINEPLDANSAFRVNLMGHSADVPGRDVVEDERWGLYGAYSWGFQHDTQVSVNWLHTEQNNIEDKGLPFDREGVPAENVAGCFDPDDNRIGRTGSQRCGDGFFTGELPPGIGFSDFFGHVDDFQRIDVDILGATLTHTFNSGVSLRNSFRYSLVKNDSITSSPRIKVPDPDAFGSGDFSQAVVQGDLKPRDQEDEGFFNQTDLLFSVPTGPIFHDLVLGAEFSDITFENRRRPDVNGPRTDLFDPERRARPAAPFDGTSTKFESETFAVYLLDTIQFSPKWELNLGVRWDSVDARASDKGWEALGEEPIDLSRTDEEFSYSAGLVFKPVPNASIYAALGSSFQISGVFDRNQIQLAGGGGSRITTPELFNVDPEETEAYEIGAKWRVLSGLDLNAAVFRTEKTKARLPGLGSDDPSVLDTEQRVDGFELLAAGRITPEWQIFGGYAYLDTEVVSSTAFPNLEGQGLGGSPEHSLNLFSTYQFTPRLNLGFGLQWIDEQTSAPLPTPLEDQPRRRNVTIDSYFVADFYGTYKLTDRAELRLNVFNLTDKKFISQLAEGGAQGIPGKRIHAIGTFRYTF